MGAGGGLHLAGVEVLAMRERRSERLERAALRIGLQR